MAHSETTRILELAYELVGLGWTQGHLAEDAQGRYADPDSPRATSWCATGALLAGEPDDLTYQKAVRRLARAAGFEDDDWETSLETAVMRWNDASERSQEDVILALKQAIVQ